MANNTVDTVPEIAYEEIASQLKTIEKHTYTDYLQEEKTVDAVIAFNCDLFQKTCRETNPSSTLLHCDFRKLCDALFSPDEIWISRDLMVTAVTQIANQEGWLPKCSKRGIFCDREGVPDEDKTNFTPENKKRTKLAKNCGWSINLVSLGRERYRVENSKAKRNRYQYKDMWQKPVKIVKTSCAHTGECTPGRQNLIAYKSAAGNYMTKLSSHVIFTLCNYYDQGSCLNHQVIKAAVRPVWPTHKSINGKDTFYIRLEIIRTLKLFRSCNMDYELFKQVANDSELLHGLDNQDDINDD